MSFSPGSLQENGRVSDPVRATDGAERRSLWSKHKLFRKLSVPCHPDQGGVQDGVAQLQRAHGRHREIGPWMCLTVKDA